MAWQSNEMEEADEKNGGPNFLRAWRIHRGLSQAALAERVGTAPNMIQYLENGERGLSAKWLRLLAPALETTVSNLLDVDPDGIASVIPPLQSDLAEGIEISEMRKRVLREMEIRGFSQRYLSKVAGLNQTAVRDFFARTSNPSIGALLSFAKALQVDPRFLIFGDAPQSAHNKIDLLIKRIPETRRQLAARVLEAFIDSE